MQQWHRLRGRSGVLDGAVGDFTDHGGLLIEAEAKFFEIAAVSLNDELEF